LGQVGPNWQLGGFAAAAPTGLAALVQAMAGFGGGSGAAENLNATAVATDTSRQPLLAIPQHA
jgi:hypothetical protein